MIWQFKKGAKIYHYYWIAKICQTMRKETGFNRTSQMFASTLFHLCLLLTLTGSSLKLPVLHPFTFILKRKKNHKILKFCLTSMEINSPFWVTWLWVAKTCIVVRNVCFIQFYESPSNNRWEPLIMSILM